jgi:acylglycerol lipase
MKGTPMTLTSPRLPVLSLAFSLVIAFAASNRSAAGFSDIPTNDALLEKTANTSFQANQVKQCLKLVRVALAKSGNEKSEQHARLLVRSGDCCYQLRQYKAAIKSYVSAKQELADIHCLNNSEIERSLTGLAASYVQTKQLDKAAAAYEFLAKRTEDTYGPDGKELLWVLLNQINVCEKLDRTEDAERLRSRIYALFSSDKRTESGAASPTKSLPFMEWKAHAIDPRGFIIAVHGLGLHCTSFQKFAKRMNDQNFDVCALDVRGFGSWLLAPGREQIDLEDSVKDISRLVQMVHKKYPDTPVFVLGESMGGALALRYAAEFPNTVNGVISSVPADRRYTEKDEVLRVTVNFLKHPHKPMSVRKELSRAATIDSVPKSAIDDPLMRTDFTPKELMKFQLFMMDTARRANKIKACPVLLIQGMKDRLVRPGATIDLFNNLSTLDKDLYLVGQCQHLIFEEVDTPDEVFDTLMVWIDTRIKRDYRHQSQP